MALIPGTLPVDTCYGTPQDLLELFAQYLDVPALALNSKVFFSTEEPNASDAIWFDTNSSTNPILKIKIGGNWTDYVSNYVENATTVTAATGDYVLISDVSDSGNAKKVTAQSIANLANVTPGAGSIIYSMLSTSATEASNVSRRVAKTWVRFNGVGSPSVTSAFNVSSIGDNGPGQYTIYFVTALTTSSYCFVGAAGDTTTEYPRVVGPSNNGAPITTNLEVAVADLNSSFDDVAYICVAIFSL